jgi:hypothetical protein
MRLPTLQRIVSELRVVVRIVLGGREAWRPVSPHADEAPPLTDVESPPHQSQRPRRNDATDGPPRA